MKKPTILFLVLFVMLSACAVKAQSQEKSYVTVQGSGLNNGVAILEVVTD